jgi:hypothetical protein
MKQSLPSDFDPLSDSLSDQEWLRLNYVMWMRERFGSGLGIMLRTIKIGSPRYNSLLQLTSLARVPEKHAEKFREAIANNIDRELYWHEKVASCEGSPRKRATAQLRRLAELLSELSELLRNLNDSAILVLLKAAELRVPSIHPPPLDEPNLALYQTMTAALAAQSAGALPLRRSSLPRRTRGRPRGALKLKRPGEPGSLARFTLRLLWDVKACGGELTLDKNNGTGTLLKALDLLRSQLPPKFVPNALPLSTLARLKSLASKASNTTGYWTKKRA